MGCAYGKTGVLMAIMALLSYDGREMDEFFLSGRIPSCEYCIVKGVVKGGIC